MRAGKLRERVTIQQKTLVSDGMGGQSETWATLATVWAAVKPNIAGAREAMTGAAGQVQARTVYEVRIRYRDDIDAKMRVLWRGNTLEIESVSDPDQRQSESVLLCVAKDTQP